jgi:GT2 family glycosyltransferase
LSTTAPQTRHTVTAIIVAHDGARLLPDLVRALHAQTYPVERVVGVDTGSRDRSGAALAELIGQDAVFGMDRSTGYGEAIAAALRHTAARRTARTDPNLRRVEWIWLLHDDCEPAPETLERLLRAASRDRSVAVLGPKVLDGQDRRVLREVGISIDRAGRRVTGIEPGEIDQGQHDHTRAVLAVGSAGMLIRRDAWDRLGGFDSHLKLFRDDLDFCWRAQGAGYRVQVVADAVLYHRELSARRRRAGEDSASLLTKTSRHPRKLDRRNGLYVLAVNLPVLTMFRVMAGCVAGSLVRAAYFLLTKQLDLAAAQVYAVSSLLRHPLWLWRGRRRRAAGRAKGYAAARTFIPPGRTLSRLAESIAGLLSSGPPRASGGTHQAASEEPEDEQFVDAQSVVRRVIANPAVQLFTGLALVALVAERRLLGTSPLGGGTLVPAWGGAAMLWREYLAGFHAVGVGSTASAPPYLAVVAALATVLGGQAWLAVDVLLLGCVPLAGLTAYIAVRRLAVATVARVWLAVSYALLPVAIGAVAAGRLGTAFAFTMLPLIAVNAGRMLTAPPRSAHRAAWATGLLVALAAAFAPLIWVFGAAFAAVVLGARLVCANGKTRLVSASGEAGRWLRAFSPRNAVIVVGTPFVVLFPWSLHLLAGPSAFLTEAGVQSPGLTTAGLGPSALLLLSPGGPGLPPVWVTAGIGLAVLAALLPHRRTELTAAGWCVAAAGFLGAVVVSRTSVTSAGGGQAASGWPGVALAVAALGLLLAAAPAAQWLAGIVSDRSDAGTRAARVGLRKLLAGVTLAAAATAPVLVAGYWVAGGVRGPVGNVTMPVLPAFISASSTSGAQYRTLILRSNGDSLDYSVVRQDDPTLGEPELAAFAPAQQALSRQVAALGAPASPDVGDPGLALGQFGIKWVLLPGPVNQALAQRLNAAVGLVPRSSAPAYDLWEVAGPVARVRVIAPDGTVTPLSAQQVGMSAVSAPIPGGTLVLAEPYGGWTAKLNGTPLKPLAAPVDGWAQGFALPPGGGRLVITRNNVARDVSLIVELIALLAVCVLALPGKRADQVAEAEAVAAVRAAQHGRRAPLSRWQKPAGRRSRQSGHAGHRALRAARVGRAGLAGQAAVAGLSAVRGRGTVPEAAAADHVPAGLGADGPAGPGAGVLADAAESAHAEQPEAGEQQEQARQRDRTGWRDRTGQWDRTSEWGEGSQWDDDDRGSDAAQRDETARLTGPQLTGPRGTGPQAVSRGTGPQVIAPWDTGPRPVAPWETGAQPAVPHETGPQSVAPWETGSQAAVRRETGPQVPVSPAGPQSAAMAPWETGEWGQAPEWSDTPRWNDTAESNSARKGNDAPPWHQAPEPAGAAARDGRDESARRDESGRHAAPAARHSHRAGRRGRPGRRRGTGDRSGSGDES